VLAVVVATAKVPLVPLVVNPLVDATKIVACGRDCKLEGTVTVVLGVANTVIVPLVGNPVVEVALIVAVGRVTPFEAARIVVLAAVVAATLTVPVGSVCTPVVVVNGDTVLAFIVACGSVSPLEGNAKLVPKKLAVLTV
jgi:hypothetical protein